jgi:outer membrane protein OmpA-like peptidoglycan-associated protein
MNHRIEIGLLTAAIAALCGCSGLPERVEPLEQARADITKLEQDPLANEAAAKELAAAHDALQDADNAFEDKQDLDLIEHYAYLAQRHADVSEQQIAEAHARETIKQGELERNRVLLQSREREAARLAEQNQEALARNSALASEAEARGRQAAEASERARQLESELTNLQAKQTERGLVLTLGDVLFDTAQATLKPGAASTLDRLAEFMRDNGERRVMIEGHTDSRGEDAYNRQLSERRADAVRDALLDRNVEQQRIRTVGLGEAYPVASNDTQAGMQENRRVEIVISDEQGNFPAGSERTATSR